MRLPSALTACVIALVPHATVASAEMKLDADQNGKARNADFQPHRYKDAAGRVLRYQLLAPRGHEGSTCPHPLLIFLHGTGERGIDNRAQLTRGVTILRAAAREHGCFVLVPQCPPNAWWSGRHCGDPQRDLAETPSEAMELVLQVVDRLKQTYRIDENRLYLMGLSMGGFGVWDAVERYPDKFAAAVPICGGGDETKAARIAKLPVWVFHGERDTVVPAELSREMVRALKAAGGEPRYTEFRGVGHNAWTAAFHEPELLDWLAAQKR